jgi:hypothetical protein
VTDAASAIHFCCGGESGTQRRVGWSMYMEWPGASDL